MTVTKQTKEQPLKWEQLSIDWELPNLNWDIRNLNWSMKEFSSEQPSINFVPNKVSHNE